MGAIAAANRHHCQAGRYINTCSRPDGAFVRSASGSSRQLRTCFCRCLVGIVFCKTSWRSVICRRLTIWGRNSRTRKAVHSAQAASAAGSASHQWRQQRRHADGADAVFSSGGHPSSSSWEHQKHKSLECHEKVAGILGLVQAWMLLCSS